MDLSTYVRVGRYDLPEPTRTAAPAGSVLAQEVSGVTYNWDTDTLFVVGDAGSSVVQVSKTGELIDSMTLAPGGSPQGSTFYDPEGITYIGGGKFVITEERDRNAVEFTYAADTTLTRADTRTVTLGNFVGNVGLEGLSFDPLTGGYIFVKESGPLGVFQTTIDFAAGTASNGSPSTVNSINLFDPTTLGLIDIADVFALSNLPALAGTEEEDNLLLLSHESAKIIEVDRTTGEILSTLNIVSDPGNPLSVVAQQHEGVTMDRDGNIYVVSENGGGDFDHPQLWVYAPSAIPNAAPTAVSLVNAAATIAENTSTALRVKVADVAITDDALGTNTLSLTGADAAFFEVDTTGLYIKAGVTLDFETRTSYAVTVAVDDTSVGATPDATTGYTLSITDIALENVAPALYISEVAPFSSGNSPVGADWFELTNGGPATLDLSGWKVDDGSDAFANAAFLNGVTSITAGESVIFIETNNLAAASTAFITTWFGGTAPAGLKFGSYSGSGLGLSTGGDGVTVFDGTGTIRATVDFGASPTGPFPTFNNAAGLNGGTISTPSVIGVNGAYAAPGNRREIGSPGTVGRVAITEVAPWSSGNSPVGADWFEVTNTTAFAIDVSGWKIDDNSQAPAAARALNGIASIAPGESVIFLETADLAATRTAFIDTWFGGIAPEALRFGSYSGAGVGLSTGGDQVNLFDATNVLRASVTFGASPTGPFASFDNSASLNNVTLATPSVAGANGAFDAVLDPVETGSPGKTSVLDGLVLGGGAGADVLTGAGTDDILVGLPGNDSLSGGLGNDLIDGGAGNDTLVGGAGADRFVFRAADGAGRDSIVDFSDEDVLLTDVKIFDSNSDDIITFGRNRKLDLAGGGIVTITSDTGGSVRALEFDGSFIDEATGREYFVYSLEGSAAGIPLIGG